MSASHGNTPAAWTAVTVMFVGFLISAFALPFDVPWLFFVGLVVVALGAVIGKVMQMMGMGTAVAFQDHRDPEYEKGRAAEQAEEAEHTEPTPQSENTEALEHNEQPQAEQSQRSQHS